LKKIDLLCPACGHLQSEPARVVSTYCRACGEHFRVFKGQALPKPPARASGIVDPLARKIVPTPFHDAPEAEFDSELENVSSAGAGPLAWLRSAEDPPGTMRPLLPHQPEVSEKTIGIAAGAFFGLEYDKPVAKKAAVDDATEADFDESEEAGPADPDASPSAGLDDPDVTLGLEAEPAALLTRGTFAALFGHKSPSALPPQDRMPQDYRPQPRRLFFHQAPRERSVRCYRCYHIQAVPQTAQSTQCQRCSVYINLSNFEIKVRRNQTLRTRGNIEVERSGSLVLCEVACHNLTVRGIIDAKLDCSGQVLFRHSGSVQGALHCESIRIAKRCEVTFADQVMTESAEIAGTFTGSMTCSGLVRVRAGGVITGAVQAREIQIDTGGEIRGPQTIDPNTTTEIPLRMGYNATVIS
jgi:cytoskeletal protein CcmA (bactofilin family)